jgi:hypothetical protein
MIIPHHDGDPRATIEINGHFYYPEHAEEARREHDARAAYRLELRDQWLRTKHGQMCKELFDKFHEYKAELEKHPYAQRRPDGAAFDLDSNYPEHMLFAQTLDQMNLHLRERAEQDRRNLEKAREAARCTHLHTNGDQCRSPRMKGRKLCYMHARMKEAQPVKLDLPPLEDANSIQVAIMKLQKAVIDGTIDHKQIGYLSNLIQIAAWNVSRTNFEREEEE